MTTEMVEITARTPDGSIVQLCIPAKEPILRVTYTDGSRHVFIPGFTPPDHLIEMSDGAIKTFRELWIENGLDPLEVDFYPRSLTRTEATS